MSWTAEEEGRRWTLDAAPRYAVERRGAYDYRMFIDDCEVDSTGLLETAFSILATRYEYEGHSSELELARLRLRQARERLEARYPRAARDGQLASVLEGLGDALGTGPEATDPERAEARASDVWRTQLSPDLWVVVDASLNTVLEVTTPSDRIVRRVPVGRGLSEALELALDVAARKTAGAEERRLSGPDDKRRAQGRLNRFGAVEWLAGKGISRVQAANAAEVMRNHPGDDSLYGMKFEDGYWIVPAQQG